VLDQEQRSNFDSWVVGVDRSGGMKYFCRKVTTQDQEPLHRGFDGLCMDQEVLC
jgi:hypothetical protein